MNNKAEYTPEKVVDISNLSREDWLEYRKKGIGGSDVAAIMGISPFATMGCQGSRTPAGRSGGRNLFQKDRTGSISGTCHVPASIISVHACRCGFFCSYAGWDICDSGM